jgi:hypothetical protein
MSPRSFVTPVPARWALVLCLAAVCLAATACEDDPVLLQGSLAGEPAAVGEPVAYECSPMPSACPTEAPSYAAEVAGIIEQHCGSCHLENNLGGPWPFSDRQDIVDWLSTVRSAVELCLMPPPESEAPLSPTDREKLQSWLACGAPDN